MSLTILKVFLQRDSQVSRALRAISKQIVAKPPETRRSDHYGYKKGIVGPVYTFVKTDYHGNFKMGVRHVAGKKYAHGRRR